MRIRTVLAACGMAVAVTAGAAGTAQAAHGNGRPMTGQAARGDHAAGRPMSAQAGHGRPMAAQAAHTNGRPAAGQSAQAAPANGRPATSQAARGDRRPMSGQRGQSAQTAAQAAQGGQSAQSARGERGTRGERGDRGARSTSLSSGRATTVNGNGSVQAYGNTHTGGVQSPQIGLIQGSLNKPCLAVPIHANVGSLIGLIPITVQDVHVLDSPQNQQCTENSSQIQGDGPLSHILSGS